MDYDLQVYYNFKKIVQTYRFDIIKEANNSWYWIIGDNQKETHIIWNYLQKGTDYLNKTIGEILSQNGFSVRFGGVFVHQKPIVERIDNNCKSEKQNCELGDLLTVFLLVDNDKKSLYRSAFISQAKKKDKIDNECQRCLYEFDEKFKLPKSMGGVVIKLPAFHRRQRGFNYLILERCPYLCLCPCLCLHPYVYVKKIPFDADIGFCWGSIIYQTLIGLNGLYFAKEEPKKSNGWSKLIWHLINKTGGELYKSKFFKNRSGEYSKRGNIVLQFLNDFMDRNLNFLFNNKGNNNNFTIGEGEGGGIPILFIIAQYRRENRLKR